MKYWKDYQNSILVWGTGSVVTGEEITEEEYIELQTEFEERQKKIADYVAKIQDGTITLNDVPAEYYDEVYAIVSVEPTDPDQAFINRLISEVNANE